MTLPRQFAPQIHIMACFINAWDDMRKTIWRWHRPALSLNYSMSNRDSAKSCIIVSPALWLSRGDKRSHARPNVGLSETGDSRTLGVRGQVQCTRCYISYYSHISTHVSNQRHKKRFVDFLIIWSRRLIWGSTPNVTR